MRPVEIRRMATGGAMTLAVTLAAAWLSAAPGWQSLGPDQALARISFSHSGDRSASCRDRTAEELAALPANMRRAQVCDRRRPPVSVELDVDGATVLARELPPSGVGGTGPSRIYARIELAAGEHAFTARLRDNPATQGFDYTAETTVILRPGQSFVIEFSPERGGFIFQ